MKYEPKSYVVSQMVKDYEKEIGEDNRLVLEFSIQRGENQYSNANQSLVIHSILQGYIIPDVFIVQDGADSFEPMSVLDGKQRLTIIYNYVTNGFKLSKTTPPVKVVVPMLDENGNLVKENGVTKTIIEKIEIKNLRFDKLPKKFQDKLKNYVIGVKLITEATKEELEEQMFRLNNGKTPTATQKAFMKAGIDVGDAVKKGILCNNFFSDRFYMTAAQERGGEDMRCALHVLALLTNADFNKLTGTNLTKITETMKDDWSNGKLSEQTIEYCNSLLEDLNYWLPDEEEFNSKEILTSLHIPIMVMNAEKARQMMDDDELTATQYKAFLKYWVTEGFYCDKYKECSEGTPSDRKNIDSRIDFMENALYDFIDTNNDKNNSEYFDSDFKIEAFINDFNLIDIPKFENAAIKSLMLCSEYPLMSFEEKNINNFIEWLKKDMNRTNQIEDCLMYAQSLFDWLKRCKYNVELIKDNLPYFVNLVKAIYSSDNIEDDIFVNWISQISSEYKPGNDLYDCIHENNTEIYSTIIIVSGMLNKSLLDYINEVGCNDERIR